jgi:hypothetical protein
VSDMLVSRTRPREHRSEHGEPNRWRVSGGKVGRTGDRTLARLRCGRCPGSWSLRVSGRFPDDDENSRGEVQNVRADSSVAWIASAESCLYTLNEISSVQRPARRRRWMSDPAQLAKLRRRPFAVQECLSGGSTRAAVTHHQSVAHRAPIVICSKTCIGTESQPEDA